MYRYNFFFNTYLVPNVNLFNWYLYLPEINVILIYISRIFMYLEIFSNNISPHIDVLSNMLFSALIP